MIPIPAVGLNVDMRNLRWSWPGYLTFGKSPKDEERKKGKKATVDEQKSDSELGSKPVTGEETSLDALVAEGDTPCSDPLKEEGKVEVEVEVDTLSLADAMEFENGHGGTSSMHLRTRARHLHHPLPERLGPYRTMTQRPQRLNLPALAPFFEKKPTRCPIGPLPQAPFAEI